QRSSTSFPKSYNNFLHGGILYGIGHLPRLRVIDIQNNQLQGSIPASLFQNPRVEVISLAFNKLGGEMNRVSGNIPKEIGNLSQLLKGEIPLFITNASKLEKFKECAKYCYSDGYFILSDILVCLNLNNETKEERTTSNK
ncbi:hypothetical protein H5410_055277, partial [Solanum commersonii]